MPFRVDATGGREPHYLLPGAEPLRGLSVVRLLAADSEVRTIWCQSLLQIEGGRSVSGA